MSTSLWDWYAVVIGLRANEDFFMPTYWSIPVRLLSFTGWVPTPLVLFGFFAAVSLILSVLFFWKRRPGYMIAACIVWGMLFADTPYALVLPALAAFGWVFSVTVARTVFYALNPSNSRRPATWDLNLSLRIRAPYGLFLIAFVTAAIVTAALNVGRCKVAYVTGYVYNAQAALRLNEMWRSGTSRAMDEILNAYVRQIADASAGRRWIFTDGLCDAGVDLACGEARTLSVMGGVCDERKWRRLGFRSWDDLDALEQGAVGLLREWTEERPESLTNAAFQCGFSYLEKVAGRHLVQYGLVMRTKDVQESSLYFNDRLLRLGRNIIAFYEKGYNPSDGGFMRKLRFCAMQWRVARACSRHDLDLSKHLDALNPFAKPTPYQKELSDLYLALKKPDFALARGPALAVLKGNPDHPDAHFALAMDHMLKKEYAPARDHFKGALKKSPNEPTLLNNLALAEMELGDLNAAESHARAALKLLPGSASIQDTLRQIQAKRTK